MNYSNKPNIWQQRLINAEASHRIWADLFLCKKLEDYWENRQWQQLGISTVSYRPYTLNLIYSTIKIKLANIIYQRPQFLLSPKPGHADWDAELASRSAELKEAALNTVVQHPKSHFVKNLRLAALDSFFRFGVVEVGYAADWQNPNKTPLITSAELDPSIDLADASVVEDEEVPTNERAYVKHIKARRFRVSTDDSPILDHCNWCGYYSFMRKSVLTKTKGIKLPPDLKNYYYAKDFNSDAGYISKNIAYDPSFTKKVEDAAFHKVWRLWDNIQKMKLLVLDYPGFPTIWADKFDRLPFPHVIWDERAPSGEDVGFYPMPPVFQWISSQDEVNQAREQLRNFRKRFTRKFWFNKNVMVDEISKLTNNVDGEAIQLKGNATGEQSIGTISNPEVGATITESLQISTSDLNTISGTSANARQAVDRTTATESKIIDMRAQVRESVEQMDFTSFVNDVGRETLLVMHENFSEGMWIKLTLDPSEDFGSEMQDSAVTYQYITNQEIVDGSYDWDIDIDVVNGTPQQQAEEEAKFIKFMGLVMQMPQLALSPILLREAAAKVGYKNERVIREFQKAATMRMLQMVQQGQQNQGPGRNGAAQSMAGNANPNPASEIQTQLQNQLGQGS